MIGRQVFLDLLIFIRRLLLRMRRGASIYHEIQEWFKAITGLAAVTTQPLAGAQGELVGLKLFRHITGISWPIA